MNHIVSPLGGLNGRVASSAKSRRAYLPFLGDRACLMSVRAVVGQEPAATYTLIDAAGAGAGSGQGTLAISINNTGAIAGEYFDSAGVAHGFVRSASGDITTYNVSTGTGTFSGTINDAGAVAGNYLTGNGVIRGYSGKIFPAKSRLLAPLAQALRQTKERNAGISTSLGNVAGFFHRHK